MMHPGDEYLYGLSNEEEILHIIDRYYTCYSLLIGPAFQAGSVESYAEQGIADLEDYLGKYAAFEEFMEGSEHNA